MLSPSIDRPTAGERQPRPHVLTLLLCASALALSACYSDDDGRTTLGGTMGGGDGDGDGDLTGDGDGDGDGMPGTNEGMDIVPENMIDDLEDCDDAIIQQGDRGGSWYAYNDGTDGGTMTPTGTQMPASGGIEGSDMCHFMTSGGGFSEWGAGVGFDFVNDGENPKQAYDASGFTGIAFWARGTGSDIRVNLVMPEVLPESEGGTCVPSTPEAGDCSDAHGVGIALSDEWRQYTIAFDTPIQQGWGQPVAFDPGKLMSMHWYIPQNQDFELAIDNIGFY